MKITIPEEYRGRFGSERAWIMPKTRRTLLHPFGGRSSCIVQERTFVFVARWEGHTLLLMNGEERNRLVGSLEHESSAPEGFTKADIKPVIMENDAIEVPEAFGDWIRGKSLNF